MSKFIALVRQTVILLYAERCWIGKLELCRTVEVEMTNRGRRVHARLKVIFEKKKRMTREYLILGINTLQMRLKCCFNNGWQCMV